MGIAVELLNKGMLMIGTFKLTSGKESPYYLDLRRLPSYPELFNQVVNEAIELLKGVDHDYIVGVATGGVPLASFIACRTGKPMGYVRLERKGYGTSRLVEGEVKGRKVVVVDDVATTGGSLRNSIEALREEGAIPVAALVIVDRQEGARQLVEGLGLKFLAVYEVSEILEEVLTRGELSPSEREKVKAYLEENKV